MFYQYTHPEEFYQRLHNKLGTVFVKTGQLLGVLWLEVAPGGKKFLFGSKKWKIWSIFASVVQISLITYITYAMMVERNENNTSLISSILVSLANILYNAQTILVYVTVISKQKFVFKSINEAERLAKVLSQWKCLDKNETCRRTLLYIVMTKLILDYSITIISFITSSINAATSPVFTNIVFLLVEPISFIGYFFITTIYCIPFAFGLFLIRKLLNNINAHNCLSISLHYQDIFKFLRDVNALMQGIILILVFGAFVGLVGEVSLF